DAELLPSDEGRLVGGLGRRRIERDVLQGDATPVEGEIDVADLDPRAKALRDLRPDHATEHFGERDPQRENDPEGDQPAAPPEQEGAYRFRLRAAGHRPAETSQHRRDEEASRAAARARLTTRS